MLQWYLMNDIIAGIIKERYGQTIKVEVTRPEPQFGDFATNVALQLAKPLGRNPREIAEEIAASLRDTGNYEKVEVAGPGFINFRAPAKIFIYYFGFCGAGLFPSAAVN